MADEWGPWIEHDGKGCPVPRGIDVKMENACGCKYEARIDSSDHHPLSITWRTSKVSLKCRFCGKVEPEGTQLTARYRIRKRRGLTILEEIAQGVREPEGV